MAKMEEIKKNIRSLLMVPDGLTLEQMLADYKAIVGLHLPYRELGFSNPFDLLKSLTDVMRPCGFDYRTNKQIYESVPDEHTDHIKNLVKNQKKQPKKSIKNYSPNHFPRQEFVGPQTYKNVRPLNKYNDSYQQNEESMKSENPQWRNNVRFPKTDNLPRRNGPRIANDLNNVQKQNETKIIKDRQNSSKMEEINSKSTEMPRSVFAEQKLSTQTINNLERLFRIHTRGIRKSKVNEVYYNVYRHSLELHIDDILEKMIDLSTYVEEAVTYVHYNDPKNPKDLQTRSKSPESPRLESPSDKINCTLKMSFFEIFDKHPNGIWIMDFIKEFQQIKNYPLEPREYGFKNFLDMVNSLTSIFAIGQHQNSDGDVLLLDARKPASSNAGLKPNELIKLVNELNKNIFKLFDDVNPIPLGTLEDLYKKKIKKSIPLQELNYSCLEEIFNDLDCNYDINKNEETNEMYISRKAMRPQDSSLQSATQLTSFNPLPSDSYLLLEYVIQTLPLDKNPKLFQPVYVTDVYSPHKFYIQLGDFEKNFNRLMDMIKETYEDPVARASYKIPMQDLQLNRLCVALFPGESWHRASIVGFIPDRPDQVKLFYIDYGTTATVDGNNLCYIKKDYMILPAQALKCRLINIKPYAKIGDWPVYTTPFFLELTQNIILQAIFLKFKDGTHYVNLCDVSGEKDSYLLDKMIENSIGLFYEDDDDEDISIDEDEVLTGTYDFEQSENLQKRFVKRVKLASGYYPFHIVAYKDNLYMTEMEICSLFTKKSNLRTLLMSGGISRESEINVSEKDEPVLFSQLRKYQVADAFRVPVVKLFPLRAVVLFVTIKGHPYCKEISVTLLYEDENYNPSLWMEYNSNASIDDVVFERPNLYINDYSRIELLFSLNDFIMEKEANPTKGPTRNTFSCLLSGKIEEYRCRLKEIKNEQKRLLDIYLEK